MSKEDQTLIRFINGGFTTLSNKPLQDKRLSLEARGLIASVLSLPQNWSFNRAWARREFKVGRDKLDRILGELKSAGYMRFIQRRGEGGKLEKGVYYISADPNAFDALEPRPGIQCSGRGRDTGLPETANPAPGEPAPIQKKPTPKETDLKSAPTGAGENLSTEEVSTPPAPRPTPAAPPAAALPIDWRNRLIQYRKRAIWAKNWGPPMHAPGCLVPPDLVREWDATQGKAFVEEEQKPAWQGRKKRDWQQASSAIN